MSPKWTGTSMNGAVQSLHVRPIPCNCPKCFHARIRAGALYCSYYDRLWPAKKMCARFKDVKGKFLTPGKKKKKKKKTK